MGTRHQGGVLREHRALEVLELPARLDPKLVDERRAGGAVRRECIGLAPAPVQGEHVECAEALAQRVLLDQLRELDRRVRIVSAREVGLDPALERGLAQLVEAGADARDRRHVEEVRERGTAPQRESRA